MDVMEFFVSADEVWFQSENGLQPLTEGSPIVMQMLERIKELYPQAYKALCQCYEKSKPDKPYYNFLIVRRFCKCNFGNLDHTRRDVSGAILNIERVSCPLMGECQHEGIICMPKMDSRLSDAEKRVMKLVCDGRSNAEIAEELYLSPNTVKRHISSAYIKSHSRNRADFVKYAKDNDIFTQNRHTLYCRYPDWQFIRHYTTGN